MGASPDASAAQQQCLLLAGPRSAVALAQPAKGAKGGTGLMR